MKTDNFTVMSNHHLNDNTLSLKAKGLLSIMLSLPDDWVYSVRGLATRCKEGVGSVNAALQELEEAGYLLRKQRRNDKGHLVNMEYTVFETLELARKESEKAD
ncbi:MAG: helix-turn-helix domain-containing protein, partial [Clostridia bacterium]|nr:helix-turn-helix domain-containing protein [Clostridia bacterium]